MAKQKPEKLFVFVVDSFGDGLGSRLEKMGLVNDESYCVLGGGGSEMIMDVPRWRDAEHLLVFMSSYHGEVEPAEELSRRIKAANPNARIIFRSNTTHSDDPVFERCLSKRGDDWDEFFTIIERFVQEHGGVSTR